MTASWYHEVGARASCAALDHLRADEVFVRNHSAGRRYGHAAASHTPPSRWCRRPFASGAQVAVSTHGSAGAIVAAGAAIRRRSDLRAARRCFPARTGSWRDCGHSSQTGFVVTLEVVQAHVTCLQPAKPRRPNAGSNAAPHLENPMAWSHLPVGMVSTEKSRHKLIPADAQIRPACVLVEAFALGQHLCRARACRAPRAAWSAPAGWWRSCSFSTCRMDWRIDHRKYTTALTSRRRCRARSRPARHVEHHGAQVHPHHLLDARKDDHQPRPLHLPKRPSMNTTPRSYSRRMRRLAASSANDQQNDGQPAEFKTWVVLLFRFHIEYYRSCRARTRTGCRA